MLSIVTAPTTLEAFPEVVDKIDIQQTIDELGDYLATPNKMIRSDDEVAALQEMRAQQQQAQQLMAAAPAMKDGAAALKSLGETPVGEGKGALEVLLEQANSQQQTPAP